MIPILFDHDEVDFTSQGLFRLHDAIDCVVTEELNGIYECELKYPIDGDFFDEIYEGRIIGATHDDRGDIQPYEIYKYSAPIDGVVTFYAHHLSYRLRRYIIVPTDSQPFHASSCPQAMAMLKQKSVPNCPFTFFTNIGTVKNYDLPYPVSIKSVLAGDGNTILNTYGYGEFEFDKWTVRFLEQRGADHGVQIRYGKNLTDIKREYDASEVYTAVIPFWYKEDSDGASHLKILSNYGVIVHDESAIQHVYWTDENGEIIRTEQGDPIELAPADMLYEAMDLSSYFDEEPTDDELRVVAQQVFEETQPWIPEDNIAISFVSLWQTPEYEEIAPLEQVSMGDYVHVIHTKLGISVLSKVVKTVYNVLLDRYDSIELGTITPSLAATILGDTNSHLEQIERSLKQSVTADYVNEQIGAATDKITGGLGGYIKVTLNADGEPQEILVMDTPSTATAQKVIRINQNGIGFSTTGYQGPFNSAWLIDGTFDAQVINVINLAATVIRTGYLTDVNGFNYWNLETGEFRLASTALLDTYGETGYVATRDYAVGDLIEVKTAGDTLIYKVTQVIPTGGTIQPGTGGNVEPASAHTLLDFARKAETITDVDVEYASHTSSITPPPEDSPLWQTTSPAWELGKYIWQRTKMIDGNNATNYSDPVCIQGAQGTNTAIIYLYKRSASAATIDWTNPLTYSFATNALMSLPTGWYDSIDDIPASNDPIYMTAATASSKDSTDVIPYHEWAIPIKMSQNGADAPKTAFVTLYKRSSSSNPVGPSGVLTYQFSDASLTPSANLNGWSREIPASDGNPCYSIQAVAIGTGSSVSIAVNNWSSPPLQILSDGINGHNSKIVYLYKRDSSVPSKPTGTFNYTFSTDTLSPMPSGWSRNYVGDNQTPARPLYVIAVTVNASADTDAVEFNGSSWSEPVILVQDGTPGVKGESSVVVNLYKRSTTTISAIDWNRNLKYDFSTNALVSTGGSQPAEPTGWTQAVPDTSTDGDLYVTAATVSSTETQVEIPANAWATPVCITKNGLSWSSAAVFLYARAATSTDLVKPTQDLTYTFSTGILSRGGQSGPTVLGQWSQSIPASDSNHYPCFVIQATAVSSDGQTDTIASGEWQGPFILVSDGEDGLNCATVSLYARAASASDLTSLKPNVALEYNFSDGKLYYNDSIWTSQTWSQQIPDSDAQRNPCFVIQATASNTATIDEIAANSWSNPTKVVVDGQDGKSISSITEYYARSESNSVAPSSWSTTVPTLTDVYKYLWNYEVISYSDSTTDESAKRVIGVYGNTGKGISSMVEYYAINNSTTAPVDSDFSTVLMNPTEANPYLWNYEVTTYTDNTTSSTDKRIIGHYGKDGEAGRGIASVTEYYARNNSTTPPADSAFSTSVVNPTSSQRVLWNYEVITYSNGDTERTDKRMISVFGSKGESGKGISSIVEYYAINNSTTAPADNDFSTTLTNPTESNPYLWNFERITYTSGSPATEDTDKRIIGHYGKDGKSISSVTEYYALNNSTTAPEDSAFTTTIQNPTSSNKYLWNYEVVTYSDGTTSPTGKRIIGTYGEPGSAGKGISSIVEYYAINNSTTAPSKSSFSTSIVTPTADNPYLWNYEVTTYTDTTTSETDRHIIGRYGKDGEAGKGISSIVEYYARSESNSVAPSSWSTTVPTLTNTYKYLWNYEVTTYTDNTTHETAKRVIGVRGNNGSAGKGISSIANHYLATSLGSGVTKQTAGWTTDPTEAVMTVTDKYLWAYETITYTDETTSETDPTIIGVYGESGKGINEIEEQYALGSSTSTAPASGWSATQPAWERGSYIWTRSKITWSDSSITYTTPVCASAINGANEAVVNLDDSLTQNEVFKRLTNGFNTEGIFLENGRLFVNSTGIATGFIHDKATVGGTNVTFYNEQNNIASRDYAIGDYITHDSYACQAKKAIYAHEWINNSSAYTTNVTRLGTVYGESSNVATRDYAVNDYIVFGGNLYQATVAIPTGTTISSSGFKNCNLLGVCYIQTSYYATQAYSSGNYIKSSSNLYQATTSIASGDMIFPGANVNYLSLGSMYHNYWNLNTGQFVTARGLIAGFNIGESTYNGSSWSSLFYMSAMRDNVYNWGYPYSAVNTPVQGVGLRGSSDSVNLGFNIISQGRMYVNNANTNYAGRIRMSAGMLYFDLGLSPTSVNSSWTTAAYINPWSGTGGTGLNINGNLAVTGNFAASGSKSRLIETDGYGKRLLYSYETPSPMFGDVGEGEIGNDGLCYIWLEPIFAQSINEGQYQVFLQKYGEGDCYISERNSKYFVVKGTIGLMFGWELKAKQKDYTMIRLGVFDDTPVSGSGADNLIERTEEYLQNLREGRVTQ